MAIRLNSVSKAFMVSDRRRRPLYRELMSLRNHQRPEGRKVVLNDLQLEIPDGSRVAVIGRNGAGKSTLLRLIAGIYRPNSGSVDVDGRLCCFLEPGAGAASALPVRDNVFLYASLAGLGWRETRDSLERILKFCGLENQEFTWVEHLSFGMQQRLFMSILIETMRLQRAEVFLFDEFLMGVDQAFRGKVEDALIHYPGTNQIVLHASHDHELMRRTCPSAIWVEDCRIRSFGPTEDILERYRHDPHDG
ncbi:ABC transporter ATP-binding protein [Elongatibacter sediminis]|uniref:ATP-binding cassette domain-containing protein n=1 Tax=Elongatibacter sediminis TaxID=3119006 RepID=A0AAW9RC43_9GAMM